MKHVFISHATTDGDIAGRICYALERAGARVWMAPRDVPYGSSYPKSIVQAIRDAGVVVLVLSSKANRSQHVHREVERAAAADIPIVVFRYEDVALAEEIEYFVSLNHWLDATDGVLDEHLDALCRRVGQLHDSPLLTDETVAGVGSLESSLPLSQDDVSLAVGFAELADRHRLLLGDFGKEVVDYLCRRPDPTVPLTRRELYSNLQRDRKGLFGSVSFRQFASLLEQARADGCCPGLKESDDGISVVEETLTTKLERNRVLKAALGRWAAQMISPGATIAIDGGSTTLPLVENVTDRLRDEELYDLTILSNSLAICNSFGQLILESGWSDDDCPVRVIVIGGVLRPNTLAMACGADEILQRMRSELTGCDRSMIDFAFVGGNGFSARAGITMGATDELDVKRTFLHAARSAFILADATKHGVELPVQIVNWDEPFTLLTNRLDRHGQADLEHLIQLGSVVEVPE